MKVDFQVLQNSCSPHTPARMTADLFLVFLVFGAKNCCIVGIEFLSEISEEFRKVTNSWAEQTQVTNSEVEQ